jgi:hypothetical protein
VANGAGRRATRRGHEKGSGTVAASSRFVQFGQLGVGQLGVGQLGHDEE